MALAMMTWLIAIPLLGVVTGMRTLTAMAVLCWFAYGGALPVEDLISHRLPLVKIRSGFDLALHPGPESLKIIVQPQRWSQ